MAREKTSAIRRQEKEKKYYIKTKPVRHFQLGCIHNHVKMFWGVEVNVFYCL